MRRSPWIALLFIGAALLLLRFFVDENTQEVHVFRGVEMTIPYTIKIGHSLNEAQRQRTEKAIFNAFRVVDEVHNKWNPRSELTRLNTSKGGVEIEISDELKSLLLTAKALYTITEGKFDPTIEPLHRLWKSKLGEGKKPGPEEIERIRGHIGFEKIHIKGNHFSKEIDSLEIDLGGIAKGYLVDLMTETLHQLGFKNIFVEWGGEIRATGRHPEGRPWKVFVSRLQDDNPSNALAFIELSDEALATSGDYLQQWSYSGGERENETYCHIIDPMSAKPLTVTGTSVCSCTVKMKSCTIADAAATAIMLSKDRDESDRMKKRLREAFGEATFWIYTRDDLAEPSGKKPSEEMSLN